MKVYIFLCAIAGYISGAPIYYRNKIKYLKECGYRVFLFPLHDGEIFVNGLEEFGGREYPFLEDYPLEYSDKDRDAFVESMAREIPECDNITVETGSDYTAYWGELLAKRLHARHFALILDEKNPRISGGVMPFFKFKYNRHELAFIKAETTKQYFKGYMDIPEDKAYNLYPVCTNSTEAFDSPVTAQIPKNDYMLGYIGRPSKSFFKPVLDGVCAFAESVAPKRVTFSVFGGDTDEVIKSIKERCAETENLDLFITGYMFPFPEEAIKMHGMFMAGSGSSYVSAALNVPTLSMDIYNNRPLFMITRDGVPFTSDEYDGRTVLDYINQVMIEKDIPKIKGLEPIGWDYVCAEFDKHMDFLSQADESLEYYPIETLPLSKKQRAFKLARAALGNGNFEKLREKKRGI